MKESIHLDIHILWKDLQDQALQLNLTLDQDGMENRYEASYLDSRFVFLLEKFLKEGDLNFVDREELEEITSWWKTHLSQWHGMNAKYCNQIWAIMEKMKSRLK